MSRRLPVSTAGMARRTFLSCFLCKAEENSPVTFGQETPLADGQAREPTLA